jgi:hypothetical protein
MVSEICLVASIQDGEETPEFVQVIPIVASEFNGQLKLLDVVSNSRDDSSSTTATQEMLHSIASELSLLKGRIEEIQSQNIAGLASLETRTIDKLNTIQSTVRRIAIQPVVRPAEREEATNISIPSRAESNHGARFMQATKRFV